MDRIVIIGASIAGHTAAVSLREQDKDCSITLLTQDSHPLYDRRKLALLLSGAIKEEEILLTSEDSLQKIKINFLKEKKAVSVNTGKRVVYFKDKDNIGYDFLVIASGRHPVLPELPGAKKSGVSLLYTLDDYKEFSNRIIREPVCLVGSSQEAVEIAKSIVLKFKAEVKLVSRLTLDTSSLPAEIEVINIPLAEIIGESQAQAVKLEDGKAIGVSCVVFVDTFKNNIDFLKNTDIEMHEDAVLVDEMMRTSAERVFACGIVAKGRKAMQATKTWEDAMSDSLCLAQTLIKQMKGETCQTY